MEITSTDSGKNVPESPKNGVKETLAWIRMRVTSGIQWAMSTKIPQTLQDQGLKPEIYTYIERQFRATVRNNAQAARSDPRASFIDVLAVDDFTAAKKRKETAMAMLIGEFDFQDKPAVIEFLKAHLMPPAETM